MTLDQLPIRDLTTPAGIAALAIVIRQAIEMAKGSFLPWLDHENERKGAFIIAAVVYVAWLAAYGRDLAADGPVAFAAFWAAGTAAIGANEAVDAAKGVVTKNVTGVDPGAAAEVGSTDNDPNTAVVDDSTERVAPLEVGPDLDLNVNGGDPVADFDEPPRDPAFAGVG